MRLHYNTTRLHLEQLEDRRLLCLSAGGDYAVGDHPLSVTVADFNADGRQDLATLNRNHNVSVLLGNGNGMFAQPNTFPPPPTSSLPSRPRTSTAIQSRIC